MIEIPFSPITVRLYFTFIDLMVDGGLPLAEARETTRALMPALMPHVNALAKRLFYKLKADENYTVAEGVREYQKMLEERNGQPNPDPLY